MQKDGPNKGRQFFTCSKPRDDQCGFFEWADDVPTFNLRTSGGHDVMRGGDDGDGVRRKRSAPTCSVCGEKGHTKRGCSIAKQMNS